MAADNNDGKKIQLNRKMRLWNKYKNPIIGAVSVIVIVIAAVVVLRACSVGKTDGSGKTDNKNNNSTTMSASADKTEIQTTAGGTQETTASVNDNTTQTTAAMASNGSVVKITDSADEEEYSTNDLYADTVLFGDMIIVAGIDANSNPILKISTDAGNVVVMPSSDNKIIVKSTVDK